MGKQSNQQNNILVAHGFWGHPFPRGADKYETDEQLGKTMSQGEDSLFVAPLGIWPRLTDAIRSGEPVIVLAGIHGSGGTTLLHGLHNYCRRNEPQMAVLIVDSETVEHRISQRLRSRKRYWPPRWLSGLLEETRQGNAGWDWIFIDEPPGTSKTRIKDSWDDFVERIARLDDLAARDLGARLVVVTSHCLEGWKYRILWEPKQIDKIIEKRLSFYSDGLVQNLESIGIEDGLVERHSLIDENNGYYSIRRPVRLFQEYFEEHLRRFQDAKTPAVVTAARGVQAAVPNVSTFKLQLSLLQSGKMEVRGLAVPSKGQPRVEVDLPFSSDDLPAVLKALDVGTYNEARFRTGYKETLERLDMMTNDVLRPDFHTAVGRKLYDALFVGEILTELKMAELSSMPIACQLCFDHDDVILNQYPWELIADDRSHRLPIMDGVEMTRHVNFAGPPASLETQLPLRLLYINPQPTEAERLEDQSVAMLEGLKPLREAGLLTWKQLNPCTWKSLEKNLYNEKFDVIHFDGHGSFVRKCPTCGQSHYPSMLTCTVCKEDMRKIAPQGYLHFEDEERHLDEINVNEMKTILTNSETKLVFLSACSTGTVKGASAWNGLAPALIQIGIPVVIAMQASPPDTSSVLFVERFYSSLSQGKRVPVAVNDARRRIFRPSAGEPISWFMPVVYLRSSDATYGQLFNISE